MCLFDNINIDGLTDFELQIFFEVWFCFKRIGKEGAPTTETLDYKRSLNWRVGLLLLFDLY